MGLTLVELFAATMFVASSGIFFQERFRKNRILIVCAGVIALISTYFLTVEVVDRIVSARLASDRSEGADASPSISDVSVVRPILSGDEAPTEHTARRVPTFDVLSVEPLDHPDATSLVFPTDFFKTRLREELAASATSISQIRLAVAFVEPSENRAFAESGAVIGYLLVSLPSLPNCSRRFGGPSYALPSASTGLLAAVNDAAPDISRWIGRASAGEALVCPD